MIVPQLAEAVDADGVFCMPASRQLPHTLFSFPAYRADVAVFILWLTLPVRHIFPHVSILPGIFPHGDLWLCQGAELSMVKGERIPAYSPVSMIAPWDILN